MKRIWEIIMVLIGGTFIITCLKFILNLPMWVVILLGAIYVSPFSYKWAMQDFEKKVRGGLDKSSPYNKTNCFKTNR